MVPPIIVELNLPKELNFDALVFQLVARPFKGYIYLYKE